MQLRNVARCRAILGFSGRAWDFHSWLGTGADAGRDSPCQGGGSPGRMAISLRLSAAMRGSGITPRPAGGHAGHNLTPPGVVVALDEFYQPDRLQLRFYAPTASSNWGGLAYNGGLSLYGRATVTPMV